MPFAVVPLVLRKLDLEGDGDGGGLGDWRDMEFS
jgi:hypothetical protein